MKDLKESKLSYQKRRTYRVILICVTLVFSALVTVIAWAIEEQESWSRVRSVEIANQKEYLLIKNDIDERIKVLQRIGFRWGIVKGTSKETFSIDAQNYVHDYPGYQAIEWVDSSYTVQWVIPLIGNEAAQGLNLAFEENRINALNKARNKRAPTVSSPIALVQGGQGFLVYNPLYVNEIFDGFVLAVFNTQEWLEQLLGELEFHGIQKEYISQVFMNNERIFSDIGWSALQDSSYDVTTSFQGYGAEFSIITRPTKQFLRDSHTMFPELVFIVGMVISLLLSVVIYLYQKAVEVKNKSTRYNELLQVEVAEHLSTEETLAKERQRLAYILEGTNVGTWEWNVQTGETVLNERWAGIIGYTLEELSPVNIDNWMKFAHPDDLKISEEILKKNFRRELDFYDCELRMRHKNGHWVWMFGRGKVFTWTEEGKPLLMCGTHQEITQRKEYEQKIQYMATHDSLTHVPNLNVAQDRLTMALESAKRNKKLVGVLFVDLDGFKNINDSHGHTAGDAVLKAVAERLNECTRKIDTVARVGGDEFLVITGEMSSPKNAELIAEKIIKRLVESVYYEGKEIFVGASIGIAIYPDNGSTSEELLKTADDAMYTVKKSGKNNYTLAKP